MKLGIIISVVIVLLVGGLAYVGLVGFADNPTSASSPARLKKAELPSGAATIFPSGTEAASNANRAYKEAFDFFTRNDRDLNREDPDAGKADRLVDLMIAAAKAATVDKPLLDDLLPMEAGASMGLPDAVMLTGQVTLMRAGKLWDEGRKERAIEAAEAVWVFGARAFESASRFDTRYVGLQAMIFAGQTLEQLGGEESEKVRGIVGTLTKLEKTWAAKIMVIRSPRAKVGDLVNIARHDEDATFRIEATLWLGPAKFNAGSRGNLRAVNSAIEKALTDAHPDIAAAGQYAKALTLEQMRKIR